MLPNNKRKNKKALSEIVSYTLLIVIAIAMAAMVYTFLKVYIPKDKPECREEVNLIVDEYSCDLSKTTKTLNLTLTNKGLFKVEQVYLRFGETDKKIKSKINQVELYNSSNNPGLNPRETFYSPNYPITSEISSDPEATYSLEIIPIINRTVCENAKITVSIRCTNQVANPPAST